MIFGSIPCTAAAYVDSMPVLVLNWLAQKLLLV